MGATGYECSCRESTLNFNEVVTYLLEAESAKKPLEFSSLDDQAIAIIGVASKSKNHRKKKGKSKGT